MQSVMDRKITQSIVLTGDQITRLQGLAKETGKSLSEVAREAVDRFLHHEDLIHLGLQELGQLTVSAIEFEHRLQEAKENRTGRRNSSHRSNLRGLVHSSMSSQPHSRSLRGRADESLRSNG